MTHYDLYERSEGRLASPAAHRSGFIVLIPPDTDVLEIGPFMKPTLRGPKMHYVDVIDHAALLEPYAPKPAAGPNSRSCRS